jgi:hypothetical protein
MNLEVEYIEPTELEGKTVLLKEPKPVWYSEPYYYKVTGSKSKLGYEYSLLLNLRIALDLPQLELIEYILSNMNKENIVTIDKEKIIKGLKISKSTYYRWIGSLIKSNFMVKIAKNRFMINPQIVINYRKTKNKHLPDLVDMYTKFKAIRINNEK